MENPITFKVNGQQIIGVLHLPRGSKKSPGIIMCHGFTGDKVGPYPYLFVTAARFFANEGFAVLRFDFRGSGESEGNFEDQSITSELADLSAALDFIARQKGVDSTKLAVLGHSRGGAVEIIKSTQDSRIKALVTWAAPARWDDLWGEAKQTILEKGYLEFSSFKETKNLIEDDFKHNPVTLWAEKISQPWLIIHGSEDGKVVGSVPTTHSRELFSACLSSKKQLLIIKAADHDFFDGNIRQELFDSTSNFLKRNLQQIALLDSL